MKRRSFLLGTAALTSQLLVGCGGNNQGKLYVQLLKGSMPGQVVSQFGKGLQPKAELKFAPVAQLEDLFKQLQAWQKQLQAWQKKTKSDDKKGWSIPIPFFGQPQKPDVADLVTLGDYWLGAAIDAKLIQPLDVRQLKQWSKLPEPWRDLVTRNDEGKQQRDAQKKVQGEVWAVPYRWGSTVIVYRRDKFQELGWTPKDWSDLWRKGEVSERGFLWWNQPPEDKLIDRISLPNQPREVIGLVLKRLGKSYNTENLDSVPDLENQLRTLNQRVKFYSSDRYLEPLIIGDTWLAVGWSNDVLPILSRYPELSVVIPQSGTALWADLWVRPKSENKNDLLSKWIDFCLTENIPKEISLLTKTNSPISAIDASDIQEPLRDVLVSNPEVFAKSEFLLPLSPLAAEQYESLFAKIKG